MPALSGRSAGRYSKQRRRKKDRSTTSNSTQPTVPGQQHATTPGNEASSTRSGRRPPAAGVGTAASGGSVIVTHSTGLKIETNATLVESTAVLTRQPAPRKHTVSVSTLAAALRQQPISTLYPDLTEEYVGVLARWKDRFSQAVWTRMTKHGTDRTPRCIKEMNECAPVVIAMRDALNRRASAESAPPPATIIDLCSGFGFLGMLLSEVLAPGTVERIHLVDQMWPMSNAKESGPTQITWEHIRTPGWPIPLRTRKTNLKKGAEMRQLEKYVVNSASGSVIVVGIHLCGTLAIKAVELFNRRKDKIAMMCLKPCCLPGRIHAAREESWSLGTTTIDAVDLYSDDLYKPHGRYKHKKKGKAQSNTEPGDTKTEVAAEASRPMTRAEIVAANRLRQHEEPHEEMDAAMKPASNECGGKSAGASGQGGGPNQSHVRFQRWGKLLLAGVGGPEEVWPAKVEQLRQDENENEGEQPQEQHNRNTKQLWKELKTVAVQSHHFQNLFVFATRTCSPGAAGMFCDGV